MGAFMAAGRRKRKLSGISDIRRFFHRNEGMNANGWFNNQRHQFQSARHGRVGKELQVHQLHRLLRRTPPQHLRAPAPAPSGFPLDRRHQQLPAPASRREGLYQEPRGQAQGRLPDVRRDDGNSRPQAEHAGLVSPCPLAQRTRQQDPDRARRQQGGRAVGSQRAGFRGKLSRIAQGGEEAGQGSGRPDALRRFRSHHLLHFQ